MEPTASSSSSNVTRASSDLSRPKSLMAAESFQMQSLPASGSQPQAWYTRLDRPLASKFPVLHEQVSRVVRYARGPRPKVELQGPRPFLDRKFTFRGQSYTLALESSLIRVTRPLTRPWLLWILGAAYIIGLAFLSRANSFFTPPSSYVDCTGAYWGENAGCGLDGDECAPFTNTTFDFRCPSQCNSVILQNPRLVGNTEVDFVPLIVGGGDPDKTYRGDSFICAAAAHAGVISNSKGGCASLQLVGNFTNYLPLSANGLDSVGFPSVFPLSFQFSSSTSLDHCQDLRDPALALNIIVTFLLFLVFRPKPIVIFWSLLCIGFWHITLFSQPRANPPALDDAFGTFLPALFVGYAFWRLAWRFVLPDFSKMPIEAAVWYIGPFWVGVLANVTFEKIPIDRLTASDLTKRGGAITALVIILIVVIAVIINQARVVRKTGWLPYYLGWYILGGLITLVMALLPGLQYRLHHYIVAIVLMPLTAFSTRLSALYQGLLLGLFLNGVAAFGFDSMLQTAADLQRDGPSGSDLPAFLTNSTTFNSSLALANQIIHWDVLPDASEGWNGFSLLVDDVERYIGPSLNYSLAALQTGIPHFFRLAFANGDDNVGDFTMPATLWPNGTWVDPLPGPS